MSDDVLVKLADAAPTDTDARVVLADLCEEQGRGPAAEALRSGWWPAAVARELLVDLERRLGDPRVATARALLRVMLLSRGYPLLARDVERGPYAAHDWPWIRILVLASTTAWMSDLRWYVTTRPVGGRVQPRLTAYPVRLIDEPMAPTSLQGYAWITHYIETRVRAQTHAAPVHEVLREAPPEATRARGADAAVKRRTAWLWPATDCAGSPA